jgi:hypothetical protein
MSGTREHDRYADWDGAYVLGSLSLAERREYEAHLEGCDRCRLAVAELSGLPGLLGRVDRTRAFSLLAEPEPVVSDPPPPADLVARIERSELGRRRRRILGAIAAVAAAAVVVGAVAVPIVVASQPHPEVVAALQPVAASPLTAEVRLTSVAWGTRIDMRCGYDEKGAAEGGWSYALWVVDRHGAASEVSTWRVPGGSSVGLTAATALDLRDIASVQVRSIATGDVLLSTDL